ncbi:MAG: hypothetical protein ACRC92_23300 [Peptostreptococcaceae bacterium]
MNDKLTYKLQKILLENEYTEARIITKLENREVNINNASIKFRYEPQMDKGYLSFGECNNTKVCEIEDMSINEVILENDSLAIETDKKRYLFYKDTNKVYF